MSTVGEPGEGRVGEDGIGEEPHPLRDIAVAGDDETGVPVALDDQRVEVFSLLLGEPVQTKVIDEQQVRGEIAAEDRFEAVVRAGLAELAEQEVSAPEEDGMVCTSGCGTKCLGETVARGNLQSRWIRQAAALPGWAGFLVRESISGHISSRRLTARRVPGGRRPGLGTTRWNRRRGE